MSASTSETGQPWHKVQRLVPDSLGTANGLAPASGLGKIAQSGQIAFPSTVRGHLEVPGAAFTVPDQEFSVRSTEAGVLLESHPERSWPKILIELLPPGDVKSFAIRASDNTVKGELLRTRVVFSMRAAETWLFHLNHLVIQADRKTTHPFEPNEADFLYRAKIYRKLAYFEEFFGLRFLLPETISSDEVQRIETIFRGITEGEFRGRATAMSFKLLPSMIDLSTPPFSGVGEFSYEVGAPVKLFDQQVPVGPFTVHLEKAELSSPRVEEHIRKGFKEPIDVRFEVLDNQVVYRFKDYVRQPQQNLMRPLEQFKRQLTLEEPKELVDLVDEPLQGDVSEFEAGQIAMGWTFYSNLPDRYCPQQPEIDQSTGHWRVPIWLVYANGEGGHVGDLLIHKKTGVIVSHTSIEELRSKAMALAETMLHA